MNAAPLARFEFAAPGRVVFGPGTARDALRGLADWGRRALLVTGSRPERVEWARAVLSDRGIEVAPFPVGGEPTVEDATAGVAVAREHRADFVVAIGGGSAIDLAKAIAILAPGSTGPLDHLEIVGAGRPIAGPGLPCAAFPTTAGTGAEATRNSVLGSRAHGVKASLRSPHMLPRLAVADPELTLGLPADLTAWSGMDALSQLVEPFVSVAATPLTDALCREGMPRSARSLEKAFRRGDDIEARSDLMLASLLSGMALANAKLGAVHGFAAPIGGAFPAPHGAVCARLLPIVWEVNAAALRRRSPEGPGLARMREAARLLTGLPSAQVEDGTRWLHALSQSLGTAPLARWGLGAGHVPDLCAKAARASSMQGNPLPLETAELEEILHRAI